MKSDITSSIWTSSCLSCQKIKLCTCLADEPWGGSLGVDRSEYIDYNDCMTSQFYPHSTFLRRTISLLIAQTVLVPFGMVFLFVLERCFRSLGDPVAAKVFDAVIIAFGLVWFVGVTALLLAVAVLVLQEPRRNAAETPVAETTAGDNDAA